MHTCRASPCRMQRTAHRWRYEARHRRQRAHPYRFKPCNHLIRLRQRQPQSVQAAPRTPHSESSKLYELKIHTILRGRAARRDRSQRDEQPAVHGKHPALRFGEVRSQDVDDQADGAVHAPTPVRRLLVLDSRAPEIRSSRQSIDGGWPSS